MKQRSSQIVRLLSDGRPMTSTALAKALEVSPRTVKREMSSLGLELARHGGELVAGNAGYTLLVRDQAAFGTLLESLSKGAHTADEELVEVLCALFTNSYVTRDELASRLFMSRSSTGRPVKAARTLMEQHGLILSSRPHHGYYVIGAEAAIRTLAAEHVLGQAEEIREEFLPREKGALKGLGAVLEKAGIGPHDPRAADAARRLAVVGKRCSMGHPLDAAMTSDALPAEAEQVAEFLENAYETTLEEGDRLFVARLLGLSTEAQSNLSPADFEEAVESTLERIRALYGRDLTDDERLRTGLVAHLWSTCGQMQSDAIVSLPVLSQLKSLYSEAYDYAVVCGEALSTLGVNPSEDNMGYIAMHFAAATERQAAQERHRVAVVCESGFGTSELLRCRIEGRFSGLTVTQVLSERDLPTADLTDVALIVSTVPLTIAGDVPVIQVTPFLDDNDAAKICDFLTYLKDAQRIRRLFSEELFFPAVEAADKDAALAAISASLMDAGALDEAGRDAMYRREEASSTEINPGVAMAHCLLGPGIPTSYAVFTLTRPVDWGHHPVSVVFAMLISPDQGIDRRLFPVVYRLSKERDDLEALTRETDFKRFMNRFFKPAALEDRD